MMAVLSFRYEGTLLNAAMLMSETVSRLRAEPLEQSSEHSLCFSQLPQPGASC
jgi:hypothetical protein